jgi:hypothetical protein
MPNVKSRVLRGYDLQLDDDVLGMWNMDEGEGQYVYDFGSAGKVLTLTDMAWITPFDCPAGYGGLRSNGASSNFTSDASTTFNFNSSASFTVMLWVYPFNSGSDNSIVLNASVGSGVNWGVLLSGNIPILIHGGRSTYGGTVPNNQWSHIAFVVTAGSAALYINGVAQSVTVNGAIGTTGVGNNSITVLDPAGNYLNRLYGKVSHISVHSVARTAGYVAAAADPAQLTDEDGNRVPPDNGDRLVVLDYVIPDDANYTNFRVVRNATAAPRHENDGDIVLADTATAGRYTYGVSGLYDVDHNYYFRVFTQNNIDNWCPVEDATLLTVFIPDISRPPETFTDYLLNDITLIPGPGQELSLPTPNITTNRAGNEKTWIEWTESSDEDVTRTKIYYSSEKFPYYDTKTRTIEGGALVWDEVKSFTSFVHRQINNREPAYYVVVNVNRFQQFSGFAYVKLMPLEQLDDSGIPLLEPLQVHYHLVDYDRIEITWDSPVTIESDLGGYFDDRFFIYAAICDLYGNPLPLDYPEGFTVNSTIAEAVVNNTEDVFNLNVPVSDVDRLPRVSFSVNADGLVTGVARLRASSLFSVLETLTIKLEPTYQYSPDFSYKLPTGNITFNNPLDLVLLNRDSLYLNTSDFVKDGCEVSAEAGATGPPKSFTRKRVNGTYIRRKVPFAIRAQYTYKGNPITRASTALRIFDSTGEPCNITPNLKRQSKLLVATTNGWPTHQQTVPIMDDAGVDTGFTDTISYSDILLRPPQLPQSGTAYVRVTYNGFSAIRRMHMFFPTILKVALTAAAPKSDSIDVREQFSSFWLIDPDHPTDANRITKAPDNTVVKWTMYRNNAVQRVVPFYSIDNVPLANGVYSYTRTGSARNVFFGPAQASAAGKYKLVVTATVSGLIGTAEAPLEITSTSGNGFDHFIPDPDAPRILAEFPDCVNYLWADGVDYQKMTITRNPVDPAKSATKYAESFRDCSEVLLPLPIGTIVTVEAKGYEILSGDVTEQVDDDNRAYLDDANATIALDTADIKITRDNYTYVYFRRPIPIEPGGCHDIDAANCACFDLPERVCADPYEIGAETGVVLSTKINYNGKPLTIYGGGSYTNDARPPCVLVPKEPLQLILIGVFVGDDIKDSYVIDGTTQNTVYVEVKYGGLPVPANTEIKIDFFSTTATIDGVPIKTALGIPDYVYTNTTTTYPGGATGGPFSIASVNVGPISPEKSISFAVEFTTDYDGS